MVEPVVNEIRKELITWNRIASFHRAAYVLLGLIGVLCPLAVATFADILHTWQVRLLSFCAAASTGIFAAFDIGNLATRWREAWKHLNEAHLEYEAGIIDLAALTKAYRDGEEIIGTMKANPFAAQKNERRRVK
jgi:hypothetical protein